MRGWGEPAAPAAQRACRLGAAAGGFIAGARGAAPPLAPPPARRPVFILLFNVVCCECVRCFPSCAPLNGRAWRRQVVCPLHVRPSSPVNRLFSPPPLALRALCALCLPNWGFFFFSLSFHNDFHNDKRHFSSSKQSCSVIVCRTCALGSCDCVSAVVTAWSPRCIDRAWGQEVQKNFKPFSFFFSEEKGVAENVGCGVA